MPGTSFTESLHLHHNQLCYPLAARINILWGFLEEGLREFLLTTLWVNYFREHPFFF
jgi:hypothetical protein